MSLLPPEITSRLKAAGRKAYQIREDDPTRGPASEEYHDLIAEIDLIAYEARMTVPNLYRKGGQQ